MRLRLLVAAALCAAIAAGGASIGQSALSPQKVAWKRFSMWTVSIAVHKEDRGTYVGMTKTKLAQWDYAVLRYPVRIVWTRKSRYCLETTVSGRLFHRVGPTGVLTTAKVAAPPGKCPAP
jgi:hypothetical protein